MMPIRMTGTETWDKTWDTRTTAQPHNRTNAQTHPRTKVTSRGGAHLITQLLNSLEDQQFIFWKNFTLRLTLTLTLTAKC